MDALTSHSFLATASSMAWGAGTLGAQSLCDARKWKVEKIFTIWTRTSKSPSGQESCALTCSKGRSPWRCSPPRRSRWWSELLLLDFWSSTSWARTSSSSKKVTWGKSGGLALCEWPQGADCRQLHRCLMGGTRIKRKNNYTTEIEQNITIWFQ